MTFIERKEAESYMLNAGEPGSESSKAGREDRLAKAKAELDKSEAFILLSLRAETDTQEAAVVTIGFGDILFLSALMSMIAQDLRKQIEGAATPPQMQ